MTRMLPPRSPRRTPRGPRFHAAAAVAGVTALTVAITGSWWGLGQLAAPAPAPVPIRETSQGPGDLASVRAHLHSDRDTDPSTTKGDRSQTGRVALHLDRDRSP